MTDKDTGKSRGFAFVLFDDYDPGENPLSSFIFPLSFPSLVVNYLSRQ